MNTLCDHFDPYFERWYADVYRLCLVLTLHPAHAQQLLFDAALRLGAAKDPHIGEEAARDLFFESAVRLTQEEAQAISDRVYDRFSERSVALENRLHAIRSRFDRIAPYLALAVIALFLFAAWFSSKMAA